ncbi:MAG: ABC transporter permease [Chloroflexi bacterium]|nr:ABC transporter permease [Chloroflexota bacterium]
MASSTVVRVVPTQSVRWRFRAFFRDWKLVTGVAILLGLLLFGLVGPLVVSEEGTRLGAGEYSAPPSARHPLGTDSTGRDVLAMMVYGTRPTLRVGFLAGGIGILVGVILGLISGYYRGPVDTIIRSAADITLTIPALAVLVVLASFLRTTTVELMAVIVALFAWPWPTRTIRAQTLTLRESGFVSMSRLSGRNDLEILFLEILPNLLPFIMASFVSAVSGAILASVGLQLLGLGPILTPTLGLILQYAFEYAAIVRGMWWWWGPPTVFLMLLFIGLFLISMAMDEIANPRLKGAAE